nr:6432_t:CDS:10 [Entrophospora candida]
MQSVGYAFIPLGAGSAPDSNANVKTTAVMSTSASYQENELSKQMELLSENDKNRVINNVCLPLIEPNDHCIEQEKPKFYKIDETGDEGKMNDSGMQNSLPLEQQSVLEATSNMDRLTQLQDAIDQLAQLFHTSIVHLNQPQNHDTPKLKEDRELIVQDLCKKAKEIDTLIENLPEEELQEANREYLKMVQNAGSLLKKINDTINIIAKDQSLAKDLE